MKFLKYRLIPLKGNILVNFSRLQRSEIIQFDNTIIHLFLCMLRLNFLKNVPIDTVVLLLEKIYIHGGSIKRKKKSKKSD